MSTVLVDNKAVPETATVVKFGLGQITNTTPKIANYIFRGVLYSSLIINLALSIFTDIPQDLQVAIGKYSLQIVAFVHGISKLFGIELKDE